MADKEQKRTQGARIPPDTIERVDAWRKAQPVPPSRSAAIAALVARGLDAVEADAAKEVRRGK